MKNFHFYEKFSFLLIYRRYIRDIWEFAKRGSLCTVLVHSWVVFHNFRYLDLWAVLRAQVRTRTAHKDRAQGPRTRAVFGHFGSGTEKCHAHKVRTRRRTRRNPPNPTPAPFWGAAVGAQKSVIFRWKVAP